MKNFIDLHLHLDVSLPYPTVKKLMKAHNFPSLTETQLKEKLSVSKECANLQEYLTKFDFPLLFLQTKKDLEVAIFDLLKSLRSQGLVYTEIRFTPQLHTQKILLKKEQLEPALQDWKNFISGRMSNKIIPTLYMLI